MSGKRPISAGAAKIISARLGLSPDQSRRLAARETSRRQTDRPHLKIDMELFQLISDWVRYAILSLVDLDDEEISPKRVASRLGVAEMRAKMCLERLLALKLIAREGGRYRPTGLPIHVGNSISTAAARTFQTQLLEKAIESLENDPFETRDGSSMTMAIDPKQIPFARERIRQFRRELTEELEAMGKPSEVYNLVVHLYPVTKRGLR